MIRLRRWCAASSLALVAIASAGPAAGAQLVSIGDPEDPRAGSRVSARVSAASRPTVHSSDGVRGPRLAAVRPSGRSSARPGTGPHAGAALARTNEVGWQVAPGLEYTQWTQLEVQGPVRVFLLTARLDEPGLVLDQVSGPTVVSRAPLSRWLRVDGAVAGVNADFFDIHRTGAPLGVGVDRQRRVLHAPRTGWNTSFVIDSNGRARVLQDRLVARIVRRGQPAIGITNLNSPLIRHNGVGLYTAGWGRTAGKRVVGRAARLRQVVVRNGVVRSNSTRLSTRATIRGDVLVGRGDGSVRLRALRVGQRVRVERNLTVPARMAVGGSVQLLRNGVRTTRENSELHPRTAIGIDRDQRLLHLVVVDGRSASSKGHTLVQLARLLRSLGDEDALNLDGGGSSTMIARNAAGVVGVRNRPSDGRQRYVPNGLGFRYTAPRG
jgi:hypothetical protein